MRYDDFESIRTYIEANGDRLRSLSLDLVSWNDAERVWADDFSQRITQRTRLPDNFFATFVLGLKRGTRRSILPSLDALSLSAVSFRTRAVEMVTALNVERLRSLRLRNCPWTPTWLRAIMDSVQALRLKQLELVWIPSHVDPDDVFHDPLTENLSDIVAQFLQRLEGLEDLYLMLPEPLRWDVITSAIMQHRTTLRRLITHNLVGIHGDFFDGDLVDTAAFPALYRSVPILCFGTCIQLPALVSTVRYKYRTIAL